MIEVLNWVFDGLINQGLLTNSWDGSLTEAGRAVLATTKGVRA